MSKFKVIKIFSLSFLGKEWKNCVIRFDSLSVGEMRGIIGKKLSSQSPSKIMDTSINLIKEQFVDGIGISQAGKEIKLTKEDIDELPSEVVRKAILFLVGESGE